MNQTQFTSGPAPLWLRFFRTGTAAFCLLHILSLLPDLNFFMGEQAFILDDITSYHSSSFLPTIHSLWMRVSEWIGKATFQGIVLAIYCASLFGILINRLATLCCLFALTLKLIINNSLDFYVYGLDYFEVIALFYCLVFSQGVPDVQGRGIMRLLRYSNLLKMLQLHLCIVYFFGGFGKMLGYNWWNGESIWKAIHLYESPAVFDDVSLGQNAWLWTALGIATIFLEMLYPVLMYFRRTRNWALAGILMMHVFIGFFMGLHFFAAFMIFLNLTAWVLPNKQLPAEVPKAEPDGLRTV